jgi:outer membrane protein assembly factor BamB
MLTVILFCLLSADSPTGSIAFMQGGKVWIVDASGKGLRPLTAELRFQADRPLAWSPDGAKLLYWSHGDAGAARDWFMFGHALDRNMVNLVEKNLPAEWRVTRGAEKNIKWSADLGTATYGTPVIAGGKVFIGTNNGKPRNAQQRGGEDRSVLMCFREADGLFLGQALHDNPISAPWQFHGLVSTPVVAGQRLYYVSNRYEVMCVDAESFTRQNTPRTIWTLDLVGQLGVHPRHLSTCSPLLVDDLLFLVTGNGVDENLRVPAPRAPSFLALDRNTGKVVWQSDLPGAQILNGQWSNPVFASVRGQGQVIFPGGDGWLYGLEAGTGKLIWKFDCNPKQATPYQPGGLGEKCFFLATPVVYENKVYIGVGQEPESDGPGKGHLWCVDITRTGDLSPELVTQARPLRTRPNPNSALVWHFGGPGANAARWSFGRTFSSCAVHDGLVYAADLDGDLTCLDAVTGRVYWDADLKGAVWPSPYLADGKVYLGTDDGMLFVFAHGKKRTVLQQVDMGAAIRVPVVAANGVLYVTTADKLYAIAAPAESGRPSSGPGAK